MCVIHLGSTPVLDRHYPSWYSTSYGLLVLRYTALVCCPSFSAAFRSPACRSNRACGCCARSFKVASRLSPYHRRMDQRIMGSFSSTTSPRSICLLYEPSNVTLKLQDFCKIYQGVIEPCLRFRIFSSAITVTTSVAYRFHRLLITMAEVVSVPFCRI